ncbi:unnamed protein product (macronuclear) [Paramecium tetraurelia]|uniref:Uncharacterized protein n=1 Tax=Paramecium tetraurelia TaxID=5888 RepID=A0CBF5_PARTE|nr:uncharacterized protein GSPATT00036905001 [Paramecium tetraurelia]CAK68122.1 unnamed protein product [Paramecium tetraurelia]|eukprot:XP_001435519.1 hypothetical protein (macronuclear) [Paramecium tetraurelia strain d4-2]
MSNKSVTQSERVNGESAFKTQITTKYKLTFIFYDINIENRKLIMSGYIKKKLLDRSIHSLYSYKKQKNNYPTLKVIVFKKPSFDPFDHTDYIQFKK